MRNCSLPHSMMMAAYLLLLSCLAFLSWSVISDVIAHPSGAGAIGVSSLLIIITLVLAAAAVHSIKLYYQHKIDAADALGRGCAISIGWYAAALGASNYKDLDGPYAWMSLLCASVAILLWWARPLAIHRQWSVVPIVAIVATSCALLSSWVIHTFVSHSSRPDTRIWDLWTTWQQFDPFGMPSPIGVAMICISCGFAVALDRRLVPLVLAVAVAVGASS